MNEAALTEAYISLRRNYNDLHVVAGADVDPSGFTLLAILRNEMYFLPAFLLHYRQLGVERFVFLNDRSDDGSFEYLVDQPDVTVVESRRSFGDLLEVPIDVSGEIQTPRIEYFWRSLLHEMFTPERWALQVDLDEFIDLPEGMKLPDLVRILDKQHLRAVWGVMLDCYPQDIGELEIQKNLSHLDLNARWYFDGEQHFRLRKNRRPKTIYPGARARLYRNYNADDLFPEQRIGAKEKIARLRYFSRSGVRTRQYNAIHKQILIKWSSQCYFKNSHSTNLNISYNHLIPIQHFKFSGSLFQKIELATGENMHSNGSRDYYLLLKLLKIMKRYNGSFLYQKSRQIHSFFDFQDTGNAFGL